VTGGYHGVVLVSGHVVDAADRAAPRFPPSRVPWVTDRVREAFDDWDVGTGTTVICGGARGTDIIAAEEALSRGAHVIVCLALPVGEHEKRSVTLPGTDWVDRYRRLADRVEVRPPEPGWTTGDAAFALVNQRMVDLARSLDRTPYALFVWDGKSGDGPGGTEDQVRRLGYPPADPHLRMVDPTP
jgi:hypothetical protein